MTAARVAAMVGAVLAVTACSGHSRSAVVSSVSAAISTPLPYAGAPHVQNPLPRIVLSGDPCTDALTPERVQAAIGVVVPGEREDLPELGPACAWSNHDTGGAVGVAYTLNTHQGLSAVYANTRPRSQVWREVPPIQGFPAVAYSAPGAIDFCQASVGLADDYSLDISLSLGETKRHSADACSLVAQVADLAVTTLKEHARSQPPP